MKAIWTYVMHQVSKVGIRLRRVFHAAIGGTFEVVGGGLIQMPKVRESLRTSTGPDTFLLRGVAGC